MTKKMRLECTITTSETPGMHLVSSEMFDGTPFSLKVQAHHVMPNEPVEEGKLVTGFVYVDHVGQQGQRVALVLPAPAYNYGTNVSVNVLKLQPYQSTLDMFGGKRLSPAVVVVEEETVPVEVDKTESES